MRRPVDPERAAGDHRPAPAGQPVREVSGDVLPVRRRGAGAHDRDRPREGLVDPAPSDHPQRQRWRQVEPLLVPGIGRLPPLPGEGDLHRAQRVVRPLVVLRRDEAGAESLGFGQVGGRPVVAAARLGQRGDPSRSLACPQPPGRLDRPDGADELVARRRDPARRRASARPAPAAPPAATGGSCRDPAASQEDGLLDVGAARPRLPGKVGDRPGDPAARGRSRGHSAHRGRERRRPAR